MIGSLTKEPLAIIYGFAQALLPDEACGFVWNNGHATLATNIASDPSRYFQMEDSEVLEQHATAYSNGCRVTAVWHSHPKGPLHWSDRDRRYWVPNLLNVLVAPDMNGIWHVLYH